MPEYADIYAVAPNRTEKGINSFLDHFLTSQIESADEYEIPQYSRSPHTVYTNAFDLIRYCCENGSEVHTIYWRSDTQPEHAMVFFLSDGGLILGISTPADDHAKVDEIAASLEQFVGSDEIIVTYEDLPPESINEFQSFYSSLSDSLGEAARKSRAHRPIKGEQNVAGQFATAPQSKSK